MIEEKRWFSPSESFATIAHVNLVTALLRAVDEGLVFDEPRIGRGYAAVHWLGIRNRLEVDTSKIREHILRLEKAADGDFPSSLLYSAYAAYAALAPMAELESFLKIRLEESFWSKTYARQAAERTRLAQLPPTPPDEIQPDPLIPLEDPREEVLAAVASSERRIDPQMVHDWRMLAAKDGLSALDMNCQGILQQFDRFDQSLRPEIPLPTWAEVVERLGITAAEGELLKLYAEGYPPQTASVQSSNPAKTAASLSGQRSLSQSPPPEQPATSRIRFAVLGALLRRGVIVARQDHPLEIDGAAWFGKRLFIRCPICPLPPRSNPRWSPAFKRSLGPAAAGSLCGPIGPTRPAGIAATLSARPLN